MKKLILLCVAFLCMQVVGAQEAKEKAKKAKKETEKVVQDKKAKAKKETQKLKKDGTPDKRFKENAKAEAKAPLKKDGTPDKRFKENQATAKGEAKAAEGKAKAKKLTAAEEKENIKESTLSKAAEKKVKDKVTGTYKGRKVYTGPRGGKYYINKNGNKTYIDSVREE